MSTTTADFLVSEPRPGETDVWLLAAGKYLRPWKKLGVPPSVRAQSIPCYCRATSLALTRPPLGGLWLEPGTDL